MKVKIATKRVNEAPSESDGLRVLVDRYWPRGMKKEAVPHDLWAKNVAPSDELRRLLHTDSVKNWADFKTRYGAELSVSDAFADLVAVIAAAHPSAVTLLYAYHDAERNNAVALAETLAASLDRIE